MIPFLRTRWRSLAVTAAVGVVAYLAGRFAAPSRVETKVETKTETKIEYRDRIVEKKVQGPVRVFVRTVEKPGGEKVIERSIERGPVTIDRQSDLTGQSTDTSQSTASTVTVSGRRPRLRVAAALGMDLGQPLDLHFKAEPIASARGEYRLVSIGPFAIEAYVSGRTPASDLKHFNLEAGGQLAAEF